MNILDKTVSGISCWVCGADELKLVKLSNIKNDLNSTSFSISDSNFGVTGDIHKCNMCGFLQCSYMKDVLSFYQDLEDPSYEATRMVRKIQMKKIIDVIKKYKSGCKLLDVGAGSGILVEEAINNGFLAEGIEPSAWLQRKARDYNLPVSLGILKNINHLSSYDVITLIDIIEHVSDPIELLTDVRKLLKQDGIVAVSTSDFGSLIAKTLGFKWWNYRVPHIGYFNKKILNMAFNKCGFNLVSMSSPNRYFTSEYFLERVSKYFPILAKVSLPKSFKDLIIEFNLRDSMLGIYTPKKQ